jgi:molybdate transport system substrate-binding protein
MRRAAALAVVALAVTGCGGGGNSKLTVYAASSLTEVFQELSPDARFDFAGSDQLAFQIEEGAKADVFASADRSYTARLWAKELVDKP